jgi:hypothetical protein
MTVEDCIDMFVIDTKNDRGVAVNMITFANATQPGTDIHSVQFRS